MSHSKDVSLANAKGASSESLTKGIGSDSGYDDYLTRGDSESGDDSPRCAHCGKAFRVCGPKRFCGHACYSASLRVPIVDRFWSKVEKTETCWLWTASKFSFGYGQIIGVVNGKKRPLFAHRVSYELAFGVIPDGLQVNHRCDVPACVNPDHLFLGTQDDNLKDAAEKGRMSVPRRRVLTTADRLAIYAMPYRRGLNASLARHHGVSPAVISHVRCGLFVDCPDKGRQATQPQPVELPRSFHLLNSPFQLVPSRPVPVVGEVR